MCARCFARLSSSLRLTPSSSALSSFDFACNLFTSASKVMLSFSKGLIFSICARSTSAAISSWIRSFLSCASVPRCSASRLGTLRSISACFKATRRKRRMSSQRSWASLRLDACWQATASRWNRSSPPSTDPATAGPTSAATTWCSRQVSRAKAPKALAMASPSSLESKPSRRISPARSSNPPSSAAASGNNAKPRRRRSSPSTKASRSFPCGAANVSCTVRSTWSPTTGAPTAVPAGGAGAPSRSRAHSRNDASSCSRRSSCGSAAFDLEAEPRRSRWRNDIPSGAAPRGPTT
mmetsp:Transcript_85270/g.189512  ORF Transcript_85270/g.189512 Transcript_85270/m.189512 type:complete len:294 (+) Transcript_85270:735-1616(+)